MNNTFDNGLGGGLITSTQFTSSWGECSAIGQIENEKKFFVAQNWPNLQFDIAIGKGEFLQSYASLSGCNEKEFTKIA